VRAGTTDIPRGKKFIMAGVFSEHGRDRLANRERVTNPCHAGSRQAPFGETGSHEDYETGKDTSLGRGNMTKIMRLESAQVRLDGFIECGTFGGDVDFVSIVLAWWYHNRCHYGETYSSHRILNELKKELLYCSDFLANAYCRTVGSQLPVLV